MSTPLYKLLHIISIIQAVYIPVCVVKEIYRAKKVVGGVNDASKKYPDHELIQVGLFNPLWVSISVIKPKKNNVYVHNVLEICLCK